ncbi:hypothetical protein H8R13_04400 [Morganella morganii]|nr:hypothetical protein [Morganella morganii]MBC4010982.1 hypothetical protein [Morganella morganii]
MKEKIIYSLNKMLFILLTKIKNNSDEQSGNPKKTQQKIIEKQNTQQ